MNDVDKYGGYIPDDDERRAIQVASLPSLLACLRARDPETDPDCHEAAAMIERMAAALERIANQSAKNHEDPEEEAYESRRIAAQALSEKPGSPDNQEPNP